MTDEVEVVVAHQERVTLRVADTYIKVDAEDWRLQREVDAIAAVTVPTPTVLWHEPHVLALGALPGVELGRLGQPSRASADAWRAAGALARVIHATPVPPEWSGWDQVGFTAFIDGECRWLVDEGAAPSTVVEAARRQVDPALRPFPTVFTHGDYQAEHVFFDGDAVTGIIDWADACPGDAWFDLAVLTVGHQEHLDDVLTGYGDPVDLDVVQGWWALRRLASVRWMIEHGFDATGDIDSLHRSARS